MIPDDRHRPKYHFLPPANWINDPNGLIQWQGTYHLFYQHNPEAAQWGMMHWGHAASPDLVNWEHLPIAMSPTPGEADQTGVWSGCAVNWDGVPALVYTARNGEHESVCLATSQDGLRTWQKYPGNPVISAPPESIETLGFRDPYVWHADNHWWMVLGSGANGVGGVILLYTSPNLTDWEYLGPLASGDLNQTEPYATGEMWECPNFFRLGEKHVLIISAMDIHPPRSLYTLYFVGDFRDNRFIPDRFAKLDGGDLACYAPQSFLDEQGRRVLFGWAREMRRPEVFEAAGWAGVLTLPRLLDLDPNGMLNIRPAPEVEILRGEETTWEDLLVQPGGLSMGRLTLDQLSGDCLEIDATFALREQETDGTFGLLVRCSPDGEEMTEIRYDKEAQMLVVSTLRSSLDSAVIGDHYELPLNLNGQNHLRLRVFLDRSIIEVYANTLAVITARVYPKREDSLGIALFTERHPIRVERLRMWKMAN